MKNTIIMTAFAFVFMVTVVVAPIAQAMEATSTASTTTVVATSTMATTTATTTPVTNSTIAGLLAQLAKLTTLFNGLKAKLMNTQAEIKELRGDIKEGMTDADIKTIQELLASDPTIYPRGLVTGYFGPMTKEAIMRFQTKNGLEVTGEINEETRAALDEVIAERRGNGKFPVGLLFSSSTKQKFEDRLKDRCEEHVKATSTVAHPCMRVKEKYDWWHDKKDEKKEMKDVKKEMKEDKKDNSGKMKDDEN